MDSKGKDTVNALDGTELDKLVYERLFNEINTYTELPLMLELAAYEVSRSEYDALKEHAISYHISGLVNVIAGVVKAFKHFEYEAKILGLSLEDEMDINDYRRYKKLKECLKNFL